MPGSKSGKKTIAAESEIVGCLRVKRESTGVAMKSIENLGWLSDLKLR